MKLNVKAFTFASGILYGAGLFLLTCRLILLYGLYLILKSSMASFMPGLRLCVKCQAHNKYFSC